MGNLQALIELPTDLITEPSVTPWYRVSATNASSEAAAILQELFEWNELSFDKAAFGLPLLRTNPPDPRRILRNKDRDRLPRPFRPRPQKRPRDLRPRARLIDAAHDDPIGAHFRSLFPHRFHHAAFCRKSGVTSRVEQSNLCVRGSHLAGRRIDLDGVRTCPRKMNRIIDERGVRPRACSEHTCHHDQDHLRVTG